ncbi:MAG: putative rane protein [Bryobacterales bacterium]|nr:putative rane protein [Bryobacterales bacterium]
MFNPILDLARWLQDTSLRLDLSQSTWAVPIIGAIHMLAIAWFGGAVLVRDPRLRRFRWVGLSILMFTGALLFWSQPLRLYYSQFFRMKMLLLMLLLTWTGLSALLPARRARLAMILSIVLWAGVVLASRGIAYR